MGIWREIARDRVSKGGASEERESQRERRKEGERELQRQRDRGSGRESIKMMGVMMLATRRLTLALINFTIKCAIVFRKRVETQDSLAASNITEIILVFIVWKMKNKV